MSTEASEVERKLLEIVVLERTEEVGTDEDPSPCKMNVPRLPEDVSGFDV